MEISFTEKFILLAINHKKGRFIIDAMSLNYGIAGALLIELSELKKITLKDKKLVLTNPQLTNKAVIDECIKLLRNSKKDRKTKYWVYRIGNKAARLRKRILQNLKQSKIIQIREKKYVWGLFKSYKYFLINTKPLDEIKSKLQTIIINNHKPDNESLLLLSLMNSCKMARILFTDKKQYKAARKKLKELTKNSEIGDAVSSTIKEIQAAVFVATTSAFVGTTN